MAERIIKSLLLILILVGMVFTVFNFVPELHADVHYGTMEWVIHPEPEQEPYHISLGWYCLDQPSNCSIVMEV